MLKAVSFSSKEEVVEREFDSTFLIRLLYKPEFLAKPTSFPNLFCIPQENPVGIYPMEWGFIPENISDIDQFRKTGPHSFTFTTQELLKNLKSAPVQNRRCLVLLDGFVFQSSNLERSPAYFYPANRKMFAVAGIYNEVKPEYWNVALVVGPYKEKENYFPLILSREEEWEWLRKDITTKRLKEILITGYSKQKLTSHFLNPSFFNKLR